MNRQDASLLILKLYFNHKTDGFFRSPGAWTVMIALSSNSCVILITWRLNSYNVTSRRYNVLSQTPTATCIVATLKEAATNELQHKISKNVICATSKDSGQLAHSWSLVRAFACRLNFLWVFATDWTSFEVSKLIRRMHRLVRVKIPHWWKSPAAAKFTNYGIQ